MAHTQGSMIVLGLLVPTTVDREIFVAKKFQPSPSTTKIKPTKHFFRHINGVSLYSRVVIVTKIKPGENLTDEIFYHRKISDLQYMTDCIHTYHLISYPAAIRSTLSGIVVYEFLVYTSLQA